MADLFLSKPERDHLFTACELLKRHDVVAGMPHFVAYVEARELHVFDELQRRFPRAFLFAQAR